MIAIDAPTARRLALQIVLGQFAATLLLAGVLLALAGARADYSALLGGGISTLASLYMALSFFRHRQDADPRAIMRGVFFGEFVKLLLTAGLFVVVIVAVEVSAPALFGAYLATILVYWMALLKRLPRS